MKKIWEKAKGKVEHAADKASDTAQAAYQKAKQVGHGAKERAGDVADAAAGKAKALERGAAQAAEDALERGKQLGAKAAGKVAGAASKVHDKLGGKK